MKTSRFATLLRREWMQHGRGWMILWALPLALALLTLLVKPTVEMGGGQPPAVAIAAMLTAAITGLMLVLGWVVMLFQAPGLARRDRQDRSIEFWLSLPETHSQSLGATLLFHAVLMPLAALLAGFVLSQLLVLIVVSRLAGFGAWLALPWAALTGAGLAGVLRLVLGVVLFTLWMSPLVLLLMAASAWLKRWGVASVVLGVPVAGLVLEKAYGITWFADGMNALLWRAGSALVNAGGFPHHMQFEARTDMPELLQRLPGWALHDAALALGHLADPVLLVALAISGACFAALVLRRRLGA
jgi:hypothetical protein